MDHYLGLSVKFIADRIVDNVLQIVGAFERLFHRIIKLLFPFASTTVNMQVSNSFGPPDSQVVSLMFVIRPTISAIARAP